MDVRDTLLSQKEQMALQINALTAAWNHLVAQIETSLLDNQCVSSLTAKACELRDEGNRLTSELLAKNSATRHLVGGKQKKELKNFLTKTQRVLATVEGRAMRSDTKRNMAEDVVREVRNQPENL